MHEEIFRALQEGATVITASRRLARVLADEFHTMELARGSTVWNRPNVLPWDAFLDRTWGDWLGRWADQSSLILLDAPQEQMLWEQIIRESPAGASLLQITETARQAIETWRLMAAYRLPLNGSFAASEDWAAFAAWCREFQRQCTANGWLDRSRLSDFLQARIVVGEVYVAGFDEMTPQQTEFFAALGTWHKVEMPDYQPAPKRRKLRDSSGEIRAAAAWAERLLRADPKAQIGIIVAPDLTRLRSRVERILAEVLEPGGGSSDQRRAFHLSIGPTLAEYPIIRAALLILEFALGKLPLPRAGMLLRSPFTGGAEKEWGRRAQLDARLRKNGVWDVSIDRLLDDAASCPELQRALRRLQKHLRKLSDAQQPSDWARSIPELLEAFGWPGHRGLSSAEFQTMESWRGVVSSLASLDLTARPMNLALVVEWLHQQAATTRFQMDDEGAPVQVMGMLEAAGLRFDHLWIMGLHDEALPAPANLNPFLPTSLQRENRLPLSSSEHELEFATKLMDRLIASAPDVVFSYPETEGDRALTPSPLVAGGEWLEADDENTFPQWVARMRSAAVFEEIADETGPELVQSDSTGGFSLFKDMAACPFRAFAKHRLSARPLEGADLGLSYRDRGTTVHKALEVIWLELGSHARLMALDAGQLQSLIARGADAAVAKLGPGIGRNLEKQRLQKILAEWLELEKSRAEFTVAGIEAERIIAIGGLQIKTRADRVDALPDGRELILDYKTGQIKSRGWEGERPDEPQLPLYCATSDRPVAGVALAVIRVGELRFRGLTTQDVSLPALTKMTIDPPIPFDRQLLEWRRVLEHLAEDFQAGKAQVDPKPGACDNCGLRALCRIRELENDRG
ncbi:MAG TPA: PD-(D/E)XK nuclease family protein [Bryobacteraceae bacterium]|nr:PD-(D/E)XK nuclease family protein [Bryobacteraceae bacterium]